MRFHVTVQCISGDDALCLSHCLFLFLSSFCSPTHSPTYQSFAQSFILFLTLFTLFLSLSLSSVSFSPSFSRFRPCILSQVFCLSLSSYFTHTLAHTQSYALSHPPTHNRAHAPYLYPHLFCSITHICLSSSLSLFLSLSLSLLHTYTDIHTHSHSHTLSLIHPLIHSFIDVACVHCVVLSARTRARSLLSTSLPLPPFLILFLDNSVSFAPFLPSRTLASSPSFSHSFASSLFQLLVAMISI